MSSDQGGPGYAFGDSDAAAIFSADCSTERTLIARHAPCPFAAQV